MDGWIRLVTESPFAALLIAAALLVVASWVVRKLRRRG
jgi:hypothetical protein